SATDIESTPVLTTSTLPTGASFVDNADGTGDFDWTPTYLQSGSYDVTFYATDDSSAVDSEIVNITVAPDMMVLRFITVTPDSLVVSADSIYEFKVTGYTLDSSITDPGSISWSLTEPLGSIDSLGIFEAETVGVGRVVVSSSLGPVDTNTYLEVIPGELAALVVDPDETSVRIGDSIQFTADGYDTDGNLADVGILDWSALGRVGDIDTDGLFIASAAGIGKVAASSSINSISDTTGYFYIEEIVLTTISVGNNNVRPSQQHAANLAFRLDNYFSVNKNITGLTVHDISRGVGDAVEVAGNIDSVAIYRDIDDDSLLTPADRLLAIGEFVMDSIHLDFPSETIDANSSIVIFVEPVVNLYPHDGDSLDFYLIPGQGIIVEGGISVIGPDSANSFGYSIVNGMVADQLRVVSTGIATISPDVISYNCLIVDIPRNGYWADTLQIVNIANTGTADAGDIDSLILFRDDGNLIWDGPDTEIRIGPMVYTGDQWTRSGLNVALTDQTTRFFVATQLAEYPVDGATIALTIPQNGLEMASGNDGPYDASPEPVDTIIIESSEAVYIQVLPVPVQDLIPGEETSTLTALELTNGRIVATGLDSLRVRLYASDPLGATQEQLDSQIDSLFVYLKGDGDYTSISVNDSLLAVAALAGGEVLFETSGLSIPGSGTNITLVVTAGMNIQNAKNGNSINVGPSEAASIYLDASVISGTFPLVNDQSHIVNAFPSSLIKVNSVEGKTLFGGQSGHTVFDFELPMDGYSSGTLTRLKLQNVGTINGNEALESVKVWADLTGDGLSDDDQYLGNAIYNDGLWTLEGISQPLSAVSNRFIVTVDVSDFQFIGGTLQFQIPVEGVQMWTGTNGPDDEPVGNTEAHLIFPANRVTAISIPAASQAASPGSPGNLIFTCALYNGYTNKSQLLKTIILSNISRSVSDQVYADHELGRISLYLDADNDRIYANDSMVAVGQFVDGSLQMTGLDIALEPEKLSYFFVLAEIPLDAIDSDSLAVSIASPASLVFADPVNINGDLPLTSGGYIIVDGSVRDQYNAIEPPPRTLSPGDTSIVLFSFRPAANGDQIDKLNSVTLTNVEDADTGDIAIMELWLDLNGDDLWQNTDSLIGPLIYSGTDWRIDNLDLEITSSPPVLFAVGDISAAVSPNARFRAQLPVNGCIYESDNDGPRDFPVTAINTFTMSYSALRVDFLPLLEHYSVGQTIEVKFTATNLSDLQVMDNVYGLIVSDNPSAIILTDSVAVPQTLMPGQSADFTYSYSAIAVGTISWQLQAIAPAIYDSSAVVQTNSAGIQNTAGSVGLTLITSIPASVTQGQNNIFPLGINITHPDSSADAASLRLDSLNLAITDGSGIALAADNVFSRLLFTSGLGPLALFDDVPTLSTLPVNFVEPVIIEPGETMVISLLINIDSAATATDFKLSIPDVEAIPIADGNTLLPISIDPGVVFPLETSTCQIDIPSREMVIASSSPHSGVANYGQDNVDVMHLLVRHPGELGSSQIQLSGFAFNVVNDSNQSIFASDIMNKISVVHQSTVIGGLSSNDLGSANLNIQLNSPLAISPGEIDSIAMWVSINESTGHAGFALTIADSSAFEVRDLSSGTPLVTTTDTLLSSGSVFPMITAPIMLTYPAQPPDLCLSSTLTSSVVGGTDAFDLLELSLVYPDGVDYSPAQMDDILVSVLDTLGRPLDPNRLFDRIGVSLSGGPIIYQSYVRLQDGAIAFNFGNDGLILSPGDSVSINLIGDIETDAPYDHFVLHIQNEDAIDICDITDTTSHPGFTAVPGCDHIYPFTTAPTRIFLPAGRPNIVYDTQPVKIGYPGQIGLDVYSSDWTYEASIPLGDLSVQGLHGRILKRTPAGFIPVAGSAIFEAVYLWFDDLLVAADTVLSADSLEMTLENEFVYSRGAGLDMRLTCDIKSDAPRGNYIISFTDSTFMDIIDRNLTAAVYPQIGSATYPINTAEISLSAARLDSSFTNYPNPFQPTRDEATTIGFVLLEDAWIDIELFDITGETVKIVTLNSFRTAGSHQTDRWTGHNDAGLEVIPGTYYCRIKVKHVSGREENYRRKIAVIR
ncbi:MAG: hypothetical protein GY841_02110, partial [FCB group bacterium]|nr:hypothetical protein [FCB group bacterium]